MTLEQLRIFIAVAERQHVTRAAEALNMTASAVSSAITTLEGRHRVVLFDRVGRNVVLNAAGQAFLQEARAVLARAAAAEAALDDLGDLTRGRLSIQASRTIAAYWLPARLTRFHRAHPGIVLDVSIGNTEQVAKAVIEGAAEIGLVEGEISHPALKREVLDHDDLCLVVAADHPWAGLRAAPDPRTSEWVVREPGSGTRSALEAALAGQGLTVDQLRLAMTLPDNEAVRAAVEAGAGAAVMSLGVAADGLADGALKRVPMTLAPRTYYVLRHRQRYRSRAGEAFLMSCKVHSN